jgi:ABC-type phosphonate transport system ATPase subunit
MAINFRKVSYSYSALKKNKKVKFAVSDVNLEIAEKDEFIAIVGHTGSGKSTLVQLMNALCSLSCFFQKWLGYYSRSEDKLLFLLFLDYTPNTLSSSHPLFSISITL